MRISSSAIVWSVLAATVAAAILAPKDSEVVAPVANRDTATAVPIAVVGSEPHMNEDVSDNKDADAVLELKLRDTSDSPKAIFGSPEPVLKVIAVRAAPVQVAAPVRPTAPPLPFRVVGKYMSDGKPTVFLQYNESTVAATVGTLINEQYKVESISETSMSLLYLPLNEHQTLSIESTN